LIKYGYANFSVTVSEYYDKSDLLVREQYYLDKLNPQYNMLKIAGSSLGFKHSEETKEKNKYIIERSLPWGQICFIWSPTHRRNQEKKKK